MYLRTRHLDLWFFLSSSVCYDAKSYLENAISWTVINCLMWQSLAWSKLLSYKNKTLETKYFIRMCFIPAFNYIALATFLMYLYLYPRPTKLEGGYTGFTLSVRLSVCPSVRPSVCRRHGFRSISQVCFGISISNFICMLTVAIGSSLLIFSDVTFKMAAWRPYWIFWFPDSYFTSALNINFKLQRHNTYVYG